MDYKDYYKILGLERSAGAEDVRKAYRKMAKQHHPDRNAGDKLAEERFKDINEAYQVLNDPQKRARYDQLGSAYSNWERGGGSPTDFDWSQWVGGQPGGTRVEYGDIGDLFGQEGFSDFFRSLFGGLGGARTSTRARRPATYQQPITISLDEAYRGTTRAFQSDSRQLTVRIPAGVKTGSQVRAAGAAPDGADLYLMVDVTDDPRFERQGDDLRTTASIDIFTAALGGEASVQTMDGDVMLKIPGGTQPEQVFRLAGRGMPRLKTPHTRGDLFVRVKVRVPKDLSPEQNELLKRAADLARKS